MYPTDLGLVFFSIQGEKKGPFKILVKLFEYQTEKILDIKEFSYGSKGDPFRHIYMFEQIVKETIPCQKVDDLLDVLNNKFLLLWKKDNERGPKVQVIKLSKPDEILFESNIKPEPRKQPILIDLDQNIANFSKRTLSWRGKGDELMVLEVNADGSIQENRDEELH
jgi:hypothetical protein